MKNKTSRRLVLGSLTLPLAMALAACGSDEAATGAPSGDPIAEIPAAAGASWLETTTVSPEDGYILGNPDAPLKLVEYVSHTCGHCATYAGESAGNIDPYIASGRVSVEIRNQIHDPLDLTMAMLVRCGAPESFHPLAKQGWENLNTIISAAQANGEALNAAMQQAPEKRYQAIAETAGLIDFFAARGLPRDTALQCLADSAKAETIATNSQTQSTELGVTGTPTFFINGSRIDGTNWESVETALKAAGAR